MFAKRSKQSRPPPRPPEEAGKTEQPGPDPRDAQIERLERQLAEQRDAAKSLRDALDAATFKTEILEKSYAKQLADTRSKLAACEQQLADKLKVLSAFDGGHEEALRALNDARAEVKLLGAERDQLRKQIAQGGFRQREDRLSRTPLVSGEDTSGSTINSLIANAGWAEQKPAAAAGHASAKVTEHEAPQEEMLAPELVFTAKDKEKEEDEP
jgi:hypothetical protein